MPNPAERPSGTGSDTTVDEQLTMEFLEKVITDAGAAMAGLCTSLGDRLGLYAAMAGAGPLTSRALADRTGLVERYVREWLAAQVAGEYVRHDEGTNTYELPAEHAAVLADPSVPTYAGGAFTMLQAVYATEDTLMDAFRTGKGVGWEEHGPSLFAGTAKFFRPGYTASLVPEWLTALDGVTEKLDRGAEIADVGCGYGYSTMLMAKAFPASHFHGYDFHAPSIEQARRIAADEGLTDRVSFDVASVRDYGTSTPASGSSPGSSSGSSSEGTGHDGNGFDLITFFDCLHDTGDPAGALQHAADMLADDGTCMIIEPNVSSHLQKNVNPVGRALTAASVAVCLPSALAQDGPQALGNHAGQHTLKHLASDAGLRHWQLAAQGPVNRVYAASR